MDARVGRLLACSVWSFAAHAEAKPAPKDAGAPRRIFSAPAVIPAGGALPFSGSCGSYSGCPILLGATVTDVATNTEVSGHVELLRADPDDGWAYFVPDAPFVEGAAYDLKLPSPVFGNTLRVAVGAADVLAEGAVDALAGLTKQHSVTSSRCCEQWNLSAPQRCLDVAYHNSAELRVALTGRLPSTTQYLFKLTAYAVDQAEDQASAEFAPLWDDLTTSARSDVFDGDAVRYCYAIHARPINGGDPVRLKTGCVDNTLTDLGTHERTEEEVERWLGTCEARPPTADPSTSVDPSDDTETEPTADASVDDVNADAARTRDQGCALGLGSARASGALWWSLLLVGLGACRRAVQRSRS